MSQVIDWSKYGLFFFKQKPAYEITDHGDGERTWCTAIFPIDRFDEVKVRIETQIEFWRDAPK